MPQLPNLTPLIVETMRGGGLTPASVRNRATTAIFEIFAQGCRGSSAVSGEHLERDSGGHLTCPVYGTMESVGPVICISCMAHC